MRPMTAHPNLNGVGNGLNHAAPNRSNVERPASGSFTTRTRVFKSNETAYHNWLRRSSEFGSTYNVRKHPRDYNSVQTFNLRSGCQVTRSASQLQVRIDPDEFFNTKATKPAEPQISVKEMELLIESLQEQVRYLTVYFEEEKLHHAGTKKRAMMDIEKTKIEMDKIKQEELERVLNNQAEIIAELKAEHSQQMEELEEDLKSQYKKLEKEYKMLQASFKNYRSKVSEEMDVKWNDRKKDFEWEKQRAVDNAVDNTRRAMEERFNKERISIRKEYKELMQQMVDDQRKEMEDFMRKMSDGKSSIEELKAKAFKADQLENELQVVNEQLLATKREIKVLTYELNETKAHLAVYENKFEEKVGAVEDKYRKRIDDLVNEVSDFRLLLIKKAETMYVERAAADELQKKWTIFAKEKLEERLFEKTDKTIQIENTKNIILSGNHEPSTKEDTEANGGIIIEDIGRDDVGLNRELKNKKTVIHIPHARIDSPPSRESTRTFSPLPRRKNLSAKTKISNEKYTSLTVESRDNIRPRLPLTAVSLLDTANLPYLDDNVAENRTDTPTSASRPLSPDVIY